MLLTRTPLYSGLLPFTFDLHVLGTPPAFALSQDQTLMFNLFAARLSAAAKLTILLNPLLISYLLACCWSPLQQTILQKKLFEAFRHHLICQLTCVSPIKLPTRPHFLIQKIHPNCQRSNFVASTFVKEDNRSAQPVSHRPDFHNLVAFGEVITSANSFLAQ